MSAKLEAEYKGYTISWDDFNSSLNVKRYGERITTARFETIAECEKWIDKQFKRKFNRVRAYLRGRYGDKTEYITGEVTSLVGYDECWFVADNGDRSKESIKTVFPVNAVNTDIVGQFQLKADEKILLEKEMSVLRAKLSIIAPEDVDPTL